LPGYNFCYKPTISHTTVVLTKRFVTNISISRSRHGDESTLSQKKNVTFLYFVITYSDVIQLCQLPGNWKQTYTAHLIPVLCVHNVPCKNEQQFLWHTIQIYVTPHFIAPGLWPQSSHYGPNLIPVDCKVWDVMQSCRPNPILDGADLKWCLTVAQPDCSST